MIKNNRQSIYYWKCDRQNAFYALQENPSKIETTVSDDLLISLLSRYFGHNEFTFHPAGGQGNHITYLVFYKKDTFFLRIEDGPEGDNYMGVESKVMDEVRANGVSIPRIFEVDVSRISVPFTYQIMEFIDFPDLNSIYKKGELNLLMVGEQIGEYIARWQAIKPGGFGPFDPACLETENRLKGLHARYQDYFLLNWELHLDFLADRKFLMEEEKNHLKNIVKEHLQYLQIKQGCLVHKDLALWNILGNSEEIKAFIDWDDSISGDPTDDLSLLACFHNWEFMESVLNGYQKVRKLPGHFETHFLAPLIAKYDSQGSYQGWGRLF